MTMVLATTAAAVDVTASYDGTVAQKGGSQVIVAGNLLATGSNVIGTMALSTGDATFSGLYPVQGTVKGAKLKMQGLDAATGTKFVWRGKASNNGLAGKVKVRGGGQKIGGKLKLNKRNEQPTGPAPEHCDSEFFTGQVMGRVLTICAGCHVQGGSASTTSFRVSANDPLATQDSVALHVDSANPAASRILQKPLNTVPHGGGVRLLPGSEEYGILEQWVNLVATGQQCGGGPADAPMVAIAPDELLERASMDLRGKRAAAGELASVEVDPNSFETFVDQYLHTPEFIERLKDVYDDALLVRREDFFDAARDETSAIYAEAVELIAYIVKNDRPFTELGTADYTVANSLFQQNMARMPYQMQPVSGLEWQPTHYLDGRPHAGLLSTSAFYEVWDTNNTNINRRRANRWSIVFHCYNFLDTPVDVTRDVDNNDQGAVLSAVTTRQDCKACHDRLDPLASFMFPMDNAMGLEDGDGTTFDTDFYDPTNADRWRSRNKRPPAVYGLPGGTLQDMGRLLVTNPKFAECQTKRAFKLLFLRDPKTNLELNMVGDIAGKWSSEDGYNFRKLVKRWMLSDAYKQRPVDNNPDWVRRTSPERLETAVQDLTGFLWTRDPDDETDATHPVARTAPVPLLTTEEDGFRIILGGINGVSVSGRATNLNASVVMVQRKVAALAAEHAVSTDLALPDGSRTLLNGITGAENPATDEAALRSALARLGLRLYGTNWSTTDPQVEVLLRLYRNLYNDKSQTGTGQGQVDGTQGERAWRGVLVAMLRSPRLLIY